MLLDLKQLFEIPDEQLSVDTALDFVHDELFGEYSFASPVLINGKIINRWGSVMCQFTARYTLSLTCDRCLEQFQQEFTSELEYTLTRSEEENYSSDEYCVEDGVLDLKEFVMSHIMLNLPSKVLCKQDCKGLCTSCGANLNKEQCSCKKTNIDPRLEILGTLLK
ncbi:MAG: DUF177 domain-containing protein [Oscillospiraceae bacterium]|nr:DUF177 domain-containing protein [Oscillospiraceae bacterium]